MPTKTNDALPVMIGGIAITEKLIDALKQIRESFQDLEAAHLHADQVMLLQGLTESEIIEKEFFFLQRMFHLILVEICKLGG